MRWTWKAPSSSGGIRIVRFAPEPVVTPYSGAPLSVRWVISACDAFARSRPSGSRRTLAPARATRTTSASARRCPATTSARGPLEAMVPSRREVGAGQVDKVAGIRHDPLHVGPHGARSVVEHRDDRRYRVLHEQLDLPGDSLALAGVERRVQVSRQPIERGVRPVRGVPLGTG